MTLGTATFWAAALAMVALGWALLCLRRPRPGGHRRAGAAPLNEASAQQRGQANAAVLIEQLASLRAESGLRTDDSDHQAALLDIHRRLLAEADGVGAPPGGSTSPAGRGRDGALPPSAEAGAVAASARAAHGGKRPGLPLSIGQDGPLSLFIALVLTAIAGGGYAWLGNPAAVAVAPVAAATSTEPEVSKDDVAAMVDTLATRLENRPAAGIADLQGWVMLGRSYAALQRFDAAARAYARALALTPDDPQLLADRADMLAMQQGQRLDGEPARLIERALALDPKQLKALALAGSAAFERQQWAPAAGYWQRARALVADGSDLAQGLDRSLAEAAAAADRSARGLPPTAGAVESAQVTAGVGGIADGNATAVESAQVTPGVGGAAARNATAAAGAAPETNGAATASGGREHPAGGAAIEGTVQLASALAGKVSPDDTVFVFARAAQGPRMPLAILRRRAADLPLDFRLDDSQAMSPALKLSGFSQVVVGVRVSRSGQAMPQPGDLVGEVPATPGGAAVRITIDRIQP